MSIGAKNYLKFLNGESINISNKLCSQNSEQLNSVNSVNPNIIDIYNYSDEMLEQDHGFIQWIFPTSRASAFNPNAPVLKAQDINYLKTRSDIKESIKAFGKKMLKYWGIAPYDEERIKILNGHNGLRLSRYIECATLFGIDIDSANLFQILENAEAKKLIKPSYEEYNGESMMIWKIRYLENVE